MERSMPWARALSFTNACVPGGLQGLAVRKSDVRHGHWNDLAQGLPRRFRRKPSPAAQAPAHNQRQAGAAHAV
ncbi:MAG: hypothetical protein ABI642_16005 [Polaromonas sp.]